MNAEPIGHDQDAPVAPEPGTEMAGRAGCISPTMNDLGRADIRAGRQRRRHTAPAGRPIEPPESRGAAARDARTGPIAAGASPPEREPVVHITIGRVEVRATHSPTPSRHQQPSERRVMSLEEYLERRGRGSSP